MGLHNVEPAGKEGAGGPATSVFGGAQGSTQDPQGGSNDGWGHPSLCADAEARAERDGADRSIHTTRAKAERVHGEMAKYH